MKIREQLLVEHSKKNTELIASYIGINKSLVKELIDLFINDTYRVGQRAAWVVASIHDAHPELLWTHYKRMILKMRESSHDAIKRNVLRCLANSNFPSDLHGELADQCFTYLQDPKEAIAIKVHAMRVLAKVCDSFPEFKHELKLIIEDQLPFGSAGFKSCAKKVLKQITKE